MPHVSLRRLLLVGLTLLAAPAWAELSVTLDRNPVRPNETFTLDVKTDAVDADEPALNLPAGIQQLRRNTISSRSIINGKISAERTWRYSLVARQPGDYPIPAIAVGKDRSEPLLLTVLAADSKPSADISNQPVVLRATVDQREGFSQQQILLTVQVLRNVPMRFAQLNEPSLPTALVQKLGEDSEYETTINGSSYLVIERRYAIFPQQVGELTIAPLHFQADISSQQQQSIFGAFEQTQPISLETLPITINVKAPTLPAPWLPTPQLSLSDAISAGPYQVGEPLTWTLTLVADGLLPVQLPALTPDGGENWRLYPDQPQDQVQVTANGLRTTRSQKFALVPLHDGAQTLPAFSLPWWRLSDNCSQIATLPSQTLQVAAAATNTPANLPARNAAAVPAKPIVAPVVSTDESAPAAVPIAAAKPWSWLTALFASLWLVTLMLWWWRSRRADHATQPVSMKTGATNARQAPSPQAASRALLDACKRHDAAAAREQLLQLTGAGNLVTLAEQQHGAVAAAILELNQALYGPPPQHWQGERLAAVVSELGRQGPSASADDASSVLPPLYPSR